MTKKSFWIVIKITVFLSLALRAIPSYPLFLIYICHQNKTMKFCWILIIDKFVIIHRSDDGLYDRKAFYTVKIVFYLSSMKLCWFHKFLFHELYFKFHSLNVSNIYSSIIHLFIRCNNIFIHAFCFFMFIIVY